MTLCCRPSGMLGHAPFAREDRCGGQACRATRSLHGSVADMCASAPEKKSTPCRAV